MLRCSPNLLDTPLAPLEKAKSMQTVPWREKKLRTEENRAPKLPGNQTKSKEDPAGLSGIIDRAQVVGMDKTDTSRTARSSYGYDGHRDEPDRGDLHTANRWGFELVDSNTGVYRSSQKSRPTQAQQQRKRRKANKGSKGESSRENRSQVNDVNKEVRGPANQAIQATPPAVVINSM